MRTKRQSGVTLLETILVLSLIAIIMVGGLNLYNNASTSSKANTLAREINILVRGINSIYANKPTGWLGNLDSPATLIRTGVFPEDIINDARTGFVSNALNSPFILSPAGSNVEIQYSDNIDPNVCIKAFKSGLLGVKMGSYGPSTTDSLSVISTFCARTSRIWLSRDNFH